ncbi:MAG: DUF5615 family PIN-like protein [Thermomicrobiales bacterium]
MERDDRPPVVMRFLMDENVDDAVGGYLSTLGHDVIYSRDVLNAAAPDAVLLHLSLQFGLIVVTHDRDFKRLAKQVPPGLAGAVRKGAGRIQLAVAEDEAIPRLMEVIDEIYVNYELALRKRRRFLALVSSTQVSYITNAFLEADAEHR